MQKFHYELSSLKNDIMELGNFALNMLSNSMESLKNQDQALATEVYEKRKLLSEKGLEIENRTLQMIALYQPMASDIRTLACILTLSTSLIRIGRYGKDIAQVTLEIGNEPHFKKLVSLSQMIKIVVQMIQNCLLAFQNHDISSLEKISEDDDEVDEFRYSIFRECITYMMEQPKYISQGSHYILVARYLERCGDHACQMAEKIVYMINGKHVELK